MQFRIVVNPVAGRGKGARLAHDVHHQLQKSGADCSVQFTSGKGNAEFLTKAALEQAATGPDTKLCVVVCGGDGTIQEVVNAILAADPNRAPEVVLGLAPAGRCNDFASAFGIGGNADQITQVLLGGHVQTVDLGRVKDRYFCTVATLGFDTAVSRFVDTMKVPLAGTLAYVYGILRVLPVYQPVKARLALDDSTVEGLVYLAASANTSSYGGQLHICPDADAGDGMLDLCLVAPISRWRVLRLLHRVLRSRHSDLPEVRLVRTRSVQIESASREEIWADGEFMTETPVTIEAIPNALKLVVPSTSTS